MMQELLLGGGLVEDSKISASSGLLGAATNVGPSSCSPTSSAAAAVSPTAANSEQPNLRCPRCDSTNTKFCYYNNYNLTQPRHFCKTCRRYWTKGGALRNVPIGGGCRKAKATAGISVVGVGKPGGNTGSKAKILASDLLVGKPGFGGLGLGGAAAGFDHELPSNHPMLWASSPQNSHLLNLLRAAQRSGMSNAANSTSNLTAMISNPNPNPSRSMDPNPIIRIKEEGPMLGSHLVPEASLLRNALNARNMAVDPFVDQVPLGLSSSLWSNQYQYQYQQQQAQQHGLQLPDHGAPSSAIQELYQRLRPSGGSATTGYADQYQAVFLGNVGSSPPSSSCSVSLSNASSTAAATAAAAAAASTANMILEPAAAVAGGELGYWSSSPFAAWADMPTSHGAFP